jgi:heat shock protein HslJ
VRPSPVLVAATVLLLAGCADGEPDGGSESPGPVEGVTWVLDGSSIDALVDDAPVDARVTALFEDGEVGGSAGCNLYGGFYDLAEDGALAIEIGGPTEMACDEPLMALDQAYVAELGDVTSTSATDETLVLEGGGGTLTYEAEQQLPLEGTSWRLDGITTGTDAVSSVLAGTEVTARFEDGTMSGSSGCNTYTGGYTVDGDAIEIADLASTARACADPAVDAQELAYYDALGRAAFTEVTGSTLTLRDEQGGFLLSYVATAGA